MQLLAIAVLALGVFVIEFNLNSNITDWVRVGVAVLAVLGAQALWKRSRRSA